jgi:hypothetical protein
MTAYTTEPPVNKSPESFELTPPRRVTKLHLVDWVTRALAGIEPWTWTLGARLGRTWHRNRWQGHHPHSVERGHREAQLARDTARVYRTRRFEECRRLDYRRRCQAEALIAAVKRLLDGQEWWKPRRHVNRATGEVIETVYLPENTWSAQTALAWCVAHLEPLLAAVPRVTEKMTPRYKPGATATVEGRHGAPEKVGDWLARAQARWLGPPGAQPELPATS